MSPRVPGSRPPRNARKPRAQADRARATQELRALAHPLRLRLVEEFAGQARTTMQVAEAMGEPPTRLYHHVNALERAGILKLARTRQVRGTTEKYYEVAKKRLGTIAGQNIPGSMRGPIKHLANVMFDEARSDLLAAISSSSRRAQGNPPVAFRMLLSLSPVQVAVVRRKLLAVLSQIRKEFRRQPSTADALRWALTVAFAPRGKSTQE